MALRLIRLEADLEAEVGAEVGADNIMGKDFGADLTV